LSGTIAAAVATALVGFVLQTVSDALGVTAALERATVQGAEVVREVGDQLRETLPALVTPALQGAQFAATSCSSTRQASCSRSYRRSFRTRPFHTSDTPPVNGTNDRRK
jgi:hypothetical protein